METDVFWYGNDRRYPPATHPDEPVDLANLHPPFDSGRSRSVNLMSAHIKAATG